MTINEIFSDEVLAEEIKEKFSSDLMFATAQIKSEEKLLLRRKNIKSIEGLQMFENLTILSISGTQLLDLSPLANLTKLESLELRSDEILDTTLMNLPVLKNLQTLSLSPELQTLSLSTSLLSDTIKYSEKNGLSNAKKLSVFLDYNDKLENYAFIANLPNLRAIKISRWTKL